MRPRLNWQELAESAGYKNPKDMLTYLYSHQKMSLFSIELRLGVSHGTVRQALAKYGVPIRKRGGPWNKGSKQIHPFEAMSIEKLFKTPAKTLARHWDYHESVIYRYRTKRREEAIKAGLLKKEDTDA